MLLLLRGMRQMGIETVGRTLSSFSRIQNSHTLQNDIRQMAKIYFILQI